MSKQILTQQELKTLLSYDRLTGNFTWLVKIADKIKVGAVAGTTNGSGYRQIRIHNRIYLAHRLAWLYEFGEFPCELLDHVNRNRSDNRIENLRECNQSQNMQNAPKQKRSTSGVRGVSFHSKSKKWRAEITISGSSKYLGLFANKADAIAARKAAEITYHLYASSLVANA